MPDTRQRARWQRVWPPGIAGQLAILIIVAILAINTILTLSFMLANTAPRAHPAETTGRQAAVVELLDRAGPSERRALLGAVRDAFPEFRVSLASAGATFDEAAAPAPPARHLGRLLGAGFRVSSIRTDRAVTDEAGEDLLVRLRDGSLLLLSSPRPSPPPGGPLALMIGFIAITAVLLGIWAVLALTKPLRAIEATVEAYGPDQTFSPIPETGPREIRTLARAFNRMQERIGRLMDDRTRTLAAVGHDLRTPITRLRLRAELLDDSPEKARMIADLDQMDALVQSALTHLRDGRGDEASSTLDLQSLLQSIADGYTDLGKPVEMAPSARLAIRGRPLELERAITNIVDNAIKYGSGASISLHRDGDWALIEVADRGPGIPEAMRATVLEPFVRGEAARTMNEADGFGLGLTIARSIIEAHDGTITFADGNPAGFVVRMSLPVA
ncbi:ATP-binding protein [Phreatobacter sp. HK31-P]